MTLWQNGIRDCGPNELENERMWQARHTTPATVPTPSPLYEGYLYPRIEASRADPGQSLPRKLVKHDPNDYTEARFGAWATL